MSQSVGGEYRHCKQCTHADPQARGQPFPLKSAFGYCTKLKTDLYFNYAPICNQFDAGRVVTQVSQVTQVLTELLGTYLFQSVATPLSYTSSDTFLCGDYSQLYLTLRCHYEAYALDKPPILAYEWIPEPVGYTITTPDPSGLIVLEPIYNLSAGLISAGWHFNCQWKPLTAGYSVAFYLLNQSATLNLIQDNSELFGVIS